MKNDLSALVRSLRETAGMSQRQLAARAKVGPRAVWDLERGKPTIRLDVITRVLSVFGRQLTVNEPAGPLSGAW